MSRTRVGWMLVMLLGGGAVIVAQGLKPAFDVVSIKAQRAPNGPDWMPTVFRRVRPGGLFSATHATLGSLVAFAYDLKPSQIAGLPDWGRRALFEITAKAAGDVADSEMRLMVQSVLAERFGLTMHREKREVRFYALLPARADRRFGPYLRPVNGDCTGAASREAAAQFPPRSSRAGGGIRGCGDADELVAQLSIVLDAPVVDETGATGVHVFEMLSAPPAPTGGDSGATPFATALEEQLGLKLESRRGPLDVLVIEAVRQPTEN